MKRYIEEIPNEIRRAIKALADDNRLDIFVALLKEGEKSFSQILRIEKCNRSTLNYHLKELMKSSLIRNFYKKEDGSEEYSYYDVTKFGQDLMMNLFTTLKVPSIFIKETKNVTWKNVQLERERILMPAVAKR